MATNQYTFVQLRWIGARVANWHSAIPIRLATELERLSIQAKSAKGAAEKPGKNVKQKSGLNRSILHQNWGMLLMLLQCRLVGGLIMVAAPYTRNVCGFTGKLASYVSEGAPETPYTRNVCGFTGKGNRNGRQFQCMWLTLTGTLRRT